jgi:outer membrane protein TolC
LDERALPLEGTVLDTTGWVAAAYGAPGLRGLEQVAAARQHAVKIAGAERWPELSAFASLSQQAFPSDVWPASNDWRRDARAGLTVSWSLFDGFETKGVIQEAKANQSDAERELARARESVRQAVIQQRGELLRAAADLRARTRTVEVARRAYALAQLRYDEGASGLFELEESRRDAQIAESNEARARYDYFTALARLERYTGRPLFPGSAERGDSR